MTVTIDIKWDSRRYRWGYPPRDIALADYQYVGEGWYLQRMYGGQVLLVTPGWAALGRYHRCGGQTYYAYSVCVRCQRAAQRRRAAEYRASCMRWEEQSRPLRWYLTVYQLVQQLRAVQLRLPGI